MTIAYVGRSTVTEAASGSTGITHSVDASGNLLVLVVTCSAVDNTISNPTSAGTGTWTAVGSAQSDASIAALSKMFYAFATTSGSVNITAAVTGAGGGWKSFFLLEFSGVDTFDAGNAVNDTTLTVTAAASSGELAVGFYVGNSDCAEGTGFTAAGASWLDFTYEFMEYDLDAGGDVAFLFNNGATHLNLHGALFSAGAPPEPPPPGPPLLGQACL